MQPISVTQSGAGASAWRSVNTHISPVNIAIGVDVTGLATYTVEHTYDDVNNLPAGVVAPLVFSHPTLVNQTVDAEGSYTAPVAYFRINVSLGTGSVRMTYVQAGISG